MRPSRLHLRSAPAAQAVVPPQRLRTPIHDPAKPKPRDRPFIQVRGVGPRFASTDLPLFNHPGLILAEVEFPS